MEQTGSNALPYPLNTFKVNYGPTATVHNTRKAPISACAEPRPERNRPLRMTIDQIWKKFPPQEVHLTWARSLAERAPLALSLLRHIPTEQGKLEVLIEFSFALMLSGDLKHGEELAHHAAALAVREDDLRAYLEVYGRAAYAYRLRDDLDGVLRFLTFAVNPAAPLHMPARTAYPVRTSIAELLRHRGDFAGAAAELERLLAMLDAEPDLQSARQSTQLFLALVYSDAERHSDALPLLRAAHASAIQRRDDELLTEVRYILIYTLTQLGRVNEAVQEQEALLTFARQRRAPGPLLLEYLVHAADLWSAAGNTERAYQRWGEALELVDAHGTPALAGLVRNNVSVGVRLRGEPRRALRLAREAVALVPEELRDMLRLTQAQAHVDLGEREEAVALFRVALASARAQDDPALVDLVLLQLGDAQSTVDAAAARATLQELLARQQARRGTAAAASSEDQIGLHQRLGLLAMSEGDREDAVARFAAVEELARGRGDDEGVRAAVAMQALMAEVTGTPDEMRRLTAMIQALQRAQPGAPHLTLAALARSGPLPA